MAEILMLKINYNPRQSREIADVTSEHLGFFSFPPSNLASGAAVMASPSRNLDYFPISMISGIFRDYYCGMFWLHF